MIIHILFSDHMNSFKSLLPSIVLVIIYFVADEFFGPQIGFLCAIFLGGTEFIYIRIKEKRSDKMVLLTTLFFCIPSGIAIFSKGSGLDRFQPVVVEVALCLLMGFLAFSRSDIMAMLPAAYRRDREISPAQAAMMKKMMRVLFFIFCGHTLLVFIALFCLSEGVVCFIKGPLLYIVIILFFVVLFVRNRMQVERLKKEEWLPVVNEKGEVTGSAPRSICHNGSKLLHPVVHLHIVNAKNELFLQKRSMKKDLLPGMWDTAVGGHIGVNEKVEDALKRETFEELGVTDFDVKFIGSYLWESSREKELVFSFLCLRYNEIRIDHDEVDEGRFWSVSEIESNLSSSLFTPNFLHEFEHNLKKILG